MAPEKYLLSLLPHCDKNNFLSKLLKQKIKYFFYFVVTTIVFGVKLHFFQKLMIEKYVPKMVL